MKKYLNKQVVFVIAINSKLKNILFCICCILSAFLIIFFVVKFSLYNVLEHDDAWLYNSKNDNF